MLRRKLLLFIVLMLAIHVTSYCQPYYFRHYEVESGLSNNAVMCSAQDRMGFMWFGTRDGLNRFDGYNFKIYRFSTNNFIHALHIDASGSLLMGTERGIYRYDAQSDSFLLRVSSKYFPIDEIVSDRKGNIWFNAGNILSRYSENSGHLKIYEPGKFFSATSLGIDRNGILWVSTADGSLKRYDEPSDSFTSFTLFPVNYRGPRFVNNILCTEDEKILVGTNKAGFKIFDTKTSSYRDILLCCEKLDNLFIRSFLQVSPTEVWIGTETGVFIYNSQTGKSKKIQKNSSDQYAISDNVIYTISKDKEGGIWAGTYFGGINYYPKQFTPFQKFYYKPFENSLGGQIVREIKKDQFENLWIGTEDGGLNKLDINTGRFTYYKPGDSRQSISYICVHDLLPVEDKLWIGTYEHGLDILDIKSGKVVRHYDASPYNGFKSNFPFCLFKTAEDEIIVGSTSGIYTYQRSKDYFEPIPGFPADNWYMCVLKDDSGIIWAGIPGRGVYYVDSKTGATGSFGYDASDPTSIASDKVNAIFEDSKKNLWFATENGLCRLNRGTHNFQRYGTADGFSSNFMLAMLEDNKGQLWISTTRGLACFNPRQGKALVYTTANGLLSDQFNFSSAFKDKDGRMYFGSARGLISFRPEEFIHDSFVPPVYLTGLQIDNKETGRAQAGSPLKKSIIYTDTITLKYNQSTFSLDFAALGYTAPENLGYAYQLEGLAKTWTHVKGNRKANFTKLQPGTYIFKVKASSSAGIWGNKETRLVIDILPPWWAGPLAYTTYALLGILMIYFLLLNYRKRLERKNKRKIELLEAAQEKELLKVEITKEKEMLESKMEFFTHVAHEIRTPVTLIKIPLSKVIRKTAGMTEIENSLKIIGRNADRLIELSNQFLDFRKTELKAYRITLEQINISGLLKDAHLNFITLAEQSNIHLSLDCPDDDLFAYVDLDAFTKMIYNLLSNAVKYADTSVHISLQPYYTDDNSFTILIKNDGHLIPGDLREKIFEPFFRVRETEAKSGTGIGLALARSLAQIHGGRLLLEEPERNYNVFSLTLPIHNEMSNSSQ